jgi:hypothetical protein
MPTLGDIFQSCPIDPGNCSCHHRKVDVIDHGIGIPFVLTFSHSHLPPKTQNFHSFFPSLTQNSKLKTQNSLYIAHHSSPKTQNFSFPLRPLSSDLRPLSLPIHNSKLKTQNCLYTEVSPKLYHVDSSNHAQQDVDKRFF